MWKPLAPLAPLALPVMARAAVGHQVACAQDVSVEHQIAEAVAPLPEPMRAGATVLSYRGGRTLVTIRQGSNGMICLADRPGDDRWHVACYHKDLEPFMARGRELRAQGITERAAIDSARLAEIQSGALCMPERPTALHSLSGPLGSFDHQTGTVSGVRGLHVVYTPYATEETLGYSIEPSRERPWLMYPGKPWAHVMISGR